MNEERTSDIGYLVEGLGAKDSQTYSALSVVFFLSLCFALLHLVPSLLSSCFEESFYSGVVMNYCR